MKKRLFLVITSLLFLGQGAWAEATVSFVVSDTEKGTAESPFKIKSEDDLNTLASDVNSGTKYKNVHFKLTEDLDYSVKTFTPIGMGYESEGGKPFQGIFDGDDHIISNIDYQSEKEGVGLFGYIFYPAVIKNLKLDGCSFSGNSYVGAIVGFGSGSAHKNEEFGIYNCTVTNTTTNTTVSANDMYAGGIIGYCGNLIVSNCTSSATVSGSNDASCLGGIAGWLYEGTIDNCFFTGSIETTNQEAETGKIAGARGGYDNYDNFIEGSEGTIKLTLYDDDSQTIKNADRITYYNGVEDVDVTLSGRTLYRDNGWNTLCLPFGVSDGDETDDVSFTGTPLEGADVRTLESSEFDSSTGVLTLNFTSVNKIEAGKPYIVKWEDDETDKLPDLVNPVFQGVTISSTDPEDNTTNWIDFVGTYSPVPLSAGDTESLYLSDASKLYYPSEAVTVKSFRGYFKLKNGLTAGSADRQIRAINLDFDEQGESNSISTILPDASAATGWYTLDGRKLLDEPVQKGMYIRNGQKVMIK